MSTMTTTLRSLVPLVPTSVSCPAPAPQAGRREAYPARAPGVGYGNSSGYASARSYARAWNGQPRFRCG